MQEVVGSTPILSTKLHPASAGFFVDIAQWLERPESIREGRRFDPDTLYRYPASAGFFVDIPIWLGRPDLIGIDGKVISKELAA